MEPAVDAEVEVGDRDDGTSSSLSRFVAAGDGCAGEVPVVVGAEIVLLRRIEKGRGLE